MRNTLKAFLLLAAVSAPHASAPLMAQKTMSRLPTGTVVEVSAPSTMEMRQSLAKATADASAILTALERDPGLAAQLAKSPREGEALLRARGVTRSDTIIVEPAGDQRTITITIIVGPIKITIIIRL